ncbi:MAG: 6-carboxyhexanoate--CoA ligase [Dissulfurispiraceae bacterium]
MWNIRMRASKLTESRISLLRRLKQRDETHISGAEGFCEDSEILKMSRRFVDRAMSHSRGKPDKIIITIEEIRDIPVSAPLLPIRTLKCSSPEDAVSLINDQLSTLGLSSRALRAALHVLKSGNPMRGAALIAAQSGRRMEPDHMRGVRVSRLGIDKSSERKLARRLSRLHINNPTVKEALILASKVASCKNIVAEVCFSDDPDYTTGYLASQSSGYLRIPHVKHSGDMHGGRVFFVNENSDTEETIAWLERKPVMIEFSHE